MTVIKTAWNFNRYGVQGELHRPGGAAAPRAPDPRA